MALEDAIAYFTGSTHIMQSMAICCGNAQTSSTVMGGTADLEGTPVSEETIYDLASLTKLYTGLLTYRLFDEGILDLKAPVTRYAPQFTHLTQITVDEVLGFEKALITPQRVDTQQDVQAAVEVLNQIAPFENGFNRAYSDMHAMVMRYVIEGAAQMSYEELLESRILKPLHLNRTWSKVPDPLRPMCASYDREHRIEKGRWILRDGIEKGIPHDPKARRMQESGCAGHAGLFATLDDVSRMAQGVLRGEVISRSSLAAMARNRTGKPIPGGGWTQFLGGLCYVKHPQQFFSEVPVYESDRAIAVSGFTGHHLSIDPGNGVFACALGNRVLNRLTVVVPKEGEDLASYGLNPDGTGMVEWTDGQRIWSSVQYVHHKDAHMHNEIEDVLKKL